MRTLPTATRILAVALAAALSLGGDCDDDDDPMGPGGATEFDANLTGAAERPDPVSTAASGSATFDVGETTVQFEVEVEDIEDVTLAHIHAGGTAIAGPIVVELFNAGGTPESFTDRATLAEGTFTEADLQAGGGLVTLDALVAAMEAGNTYVNVHTSANPAGEIRGQIEER